MRLKHFLPPTYRELRRSHVAFVESANLAIMWSNKAACTTVMKWVFLHNGLLAESLAHGRWVHRYRLRQYQKSERYLSRLEDFGHGKLAVVKVVRNPFERTVSSYIHAYRMGYEDGAVSEVVQRPLNRQHRFSFREFVTFLERINLRTCNPHHRVQVTPVERRPLFRVRPRQIIKIEQGLEKALNDLERSVGLPATDLTDQVFASEHHTQRVSQHGPAADLTQFSRDGLPPTNAFYDDDLRRRVARLYAEDFRCYGYSTDAAQVADAESGEPIARASFSQVQP
ncbi:sulfotransferase family 2 domain-containing protein [Dongia deserti]|uniref:sulfotransferase family 2 domain-containing protein n=1 Tax=Dongia deserti TaxID=2268030 RepID=UPI000E65ACD2|nr:sulfotransferase family 2 domain-containing protein [Dongia deserti]